MAAIAERFVTIRPDTKNFRADLERDTERDAASVGKKLAGALAGGAFLAGAKKAVDAASNLNEAVNVTNITFGKAEGKVAEFAEGAAKSLGQSEAAARSAASTFGGLLLNLGYTETAAADTSIQLTKLASDLGSAFNTDPAEAALALSSALRGEAEPIQRYNVLLSDQAVRQEAVRLGLSATTAAVDENGKVQARLSLIMQQTSRYQDDFANTSESAANAQRIAAATAEDAAADLGENLLPIYERLVDVAGKIAGAFGAVPEPAQTAIIAIAGIAALTGPVRAAADAIGFLADVTRTGLSKGLDAGAKGAYDLAGNLGKAGLTMGALGIAAIGAEIALSSYNDTQARAERLTSLFTDALIESNGAITTSVRATAASELLSGNVGENLRDAEANVARLTTGIFDQADGLTQLNDKYKAFVQGGIGDPLQKALEEAGLAGSALGDELLRIAESGDLSQGEMLDFVDRLNDVAEGYKSGSSEGKNAAAANDAVGDTAASATPKIEDQAEALTEDEDAAKRAAAAVDLFREAVEKALAPLDREEAIDNFNQALLDEAQAIEDRATAVEDARARLAFISNDPNSSKGDRAQAERDLAEAIAESSTTLDGNSEAALRNRDALREIIDRGVDVIETARDQGASLEDLQAIRAIEVDSLRTQLTEMGYTREEVDRYIGRIEAIPLTRATVLDIDTAKADVKLEKALARWQAEIDENPLSVDVLIEERNVIRRSGNKGFAAGGDVMDGVFTVGEAGPEVMRKDGASVSVLAGGGPQALGGFDGLGEDQLLTQREMAAVLRSIDSKLSGGSNLRRTALEGIA